MVSILWTCSNRWFHDFSKSAKDKAAYLKFDTLQYGAYRWRTNQQTLEWELFLSYYIKIDKDGRYVVMRHNTTPEAALYYKGNIDNSTRIVLDSLSVVHLNTTYFNDQLRIYDGNTFHLNYWNATEHDVDFYQIDATPFLKRLADALDTVVFQSKESIPSFDLASYQEELKNRSLKRFGQLPKIEAPRFR